MKKLVFILFFCFPILVFSQTKLIPPGESYTNSSVDSMVVTTVERIKACVVKNRELKIALQEIDKSNEIILNLEKQNKALEEKVEAQKKIAESYEKQIEGSETHAENMKKEAKRQRRQKLMAMGGGAVLVVLSILLL